MLCQIALCYMHFTLCCFKVKQAVSTEIESA